MPFRVNKCRAVVSLMLCWASIAQAAELKFLKIDEQYVHKNSQSEVQLLEYKAHAPPQLVVSSTEDRGGRKCFLDDKPCAFNEPIDLRILPGQHHNFVRILKYRDGQDEPLKTIRILQFDPNLKSFVVQGKSELQKDILLTATGTLLIFSPDGELLFYRREPQEAIDFKMHVIGDRVYYSYMRVVRSFQDIHQEGVRVLLDQNLNFVRELPWMTDLHDFQMLGEDHFIYFEYLPSSWKQFGRCLLEQRAVEMKGSQIVNRFSNVDLIQSGFWHLKSSQNFVSYKGRLCRSITHLNSVQVLDADHWLIGTGGTILFYDMKKKKIDWFLGGPKGRIRDERGSLRWNNLGLVHTPIWNADEQTLTFFSNYYSDVSDTTARSTVIELKMDIAREKILSSIEFPVGRFLSIHSGGQQRDGDIVSVAAGAAARSDSTRFADFIEAKKGQKGPSMTIQFGSAQPAYVYRTYRSDTRYRPSREKPSHD